MHGQNHIKYVEAIYENKIIVKLFASSWYIFLTLRNNAFIYNVLIVVTPPRDDANVTLTINVFLFHTIALQFGHPCHTMISGCYTNKGAFRGISLFALWLPLGGGGQGGWGQKGRGKKPYRLGWEEESTDSIALLK